MKARAFLAHELMAGAISSSAELSWIEARAGQKVALRSHSSPMLLVVMRGRATLVGRIEREVEQGDVVTMPRNHAYGFSSIDSDLHVLQVKLRATTRRTKRKSR